MLRFFSQPVLLQAVRQAVFQCADFYMVLHCALEKSVQVPFLAADLPHTADIHAVDLDVSDTAQHTLIPVAQRAVPFIIDAAADYRAAVVPGLPAAGIVLARVAAQSPGMRAYTMHGAIFLDLALSLYLQLLVIKAQLLSF